MTINQIFKTIVNFADDIPVNPAPVLDEDGYFDYAQYQRDRWGDKAESVISDAVLNRRNMGAEFPSEYSSMSDDQIRNLPLKDLANLQLHTKVQFQDYDNSGVFFDNTSSRWTPSIKDGTKVPVDNNPKFFIDGHGGDASPFGGIRINHDFYEEEGRSSGDSEYYKNQEKGAVVHEASHQGNWTNAGKWVGRDENFIKQSSKSDAYSQKVKNDDNYNYMHKNPLEFSRGLGNVRQAIYANTGKIPKTPQEWRQGVISSSTDTNDSDMYYMKDKDASFKTDEERKNYWKTVSEIGNQTAKNDNNTKNSKNNELYYS